MGRKSYKALIVVFCCLVSCVKDKPAVNNIPASSNIGNVYVVCEGRFGNGEATLYTYNRTTDSAFGDLYKSVNNQQLGDVFQSMTKIGGDFFLCVNNSDKVVVLNAATLVYAGMISVPKPRYILDISPTKAYVSSEYHNKVYVFNPQTLQVTDSITFPYQNTEGMCLYNNTAFICAWDTTCNSIFKVDVNTDQVIQTIQVAGYAPQEALLDKEQTLWVLSGAVLSFDPYDGRPCAWTRIDPSSGDMLASYHFTAEENVVHPVFNNTKDTLYFIEANQSPFPGNNGIYRMGIHDGALPSQPFVAPLTNQYFWALGIDPVNAHIYVGDPKGFVQRGSVYVFKQDGTAIDTFNVGIGPGHFYFDQ